jgi:hypothetical protein
VVVGMWWWCLTAEEGVLLRLGNSRYDHLGIELDEANLCEDLFLCSQRVEALGSLYNEESLPSELNDRPLGQETMAKQVQHRHHR